LTSDFPDASAVFNCTGLGARDLGGVNDENMHPTKGQTILIEEPITPLKRMAVWAQPSLFGPNEVSHVFPRPLGGGIIIGGVRHDNNWDDSVDTSLAERAKQRACQLCPELGKPEDLKVIRYSIGLRRKYPPPPAFNPPTTERYSLIFGACSKPNWGCKGRYRGEKG
jgi:glycine/D-amino acid oxidase-like deaminating enzyme